MAPHLRGDALLEAISTGAPNEAAVMAILFAAGAWLESGGAAPINRFLRLPTTPAQLKRAARNLWLNKAARTLAEQSPFKRACYLERELNAFITRGPWATWRGRQHPPEGCSDLRRCLFYVAKFNDGEGLTDRTIYQAVK
ncbi:MAG: hypothetical protein KBF54_12175 [Rhizobiales bacterium]|nr:hypothetical protein [Hyphomicrobiales bacterium]